MMAAHTTPIPTPATCEEGVLDAPWSAPLPEDVLAIESLDEEQDAAALGVAAALLILLAEFTVPGWLPAAIDEQRTPLCVTMAVVPSFCFADNHNGFVPIRVVRRSNAAHQTSPQSASSPAHRPNLVDTMSCTLPETHQMHQYVSLLVERFRMTVGELVMAYACVERVLLLHPTTMRASSIRPMLLGASIISCKTCRDDALSLRQVPPTPLPPDRPGARRPETSTPSQPARLSPAVLRRLACRPRRRRRLAHLHRAPGAGVAGLARPDEPRAAPDLRRRHLRRCERQAGQAGRRAASDPGLRGAGDDACE